MPTVSATAIVPASAEEAFDFLADYHNIPRLQPHFEWARLVGERERGLGAVVELHGHFHGIPMHAHNRIIAYNPPRRIVSISDGNVLSRNSWEMQPAPGDGSTRVTFTLEYKFMGKVGALFTGVAGSLFHKEIQAMTNESLRRLKDIFARSSANLDGRGHGL